MRSLSSIRRSRSSSVRAATPRWLRSGGPPVSVVRPVSVVSTVTAPDRPATRFRISWSRTAVQAIACSAACNRDWESACSRHTARRARTTRCPAVISSMTIAASPKALPSGAGCTLNASRASPAGRSSGWLPRIPKITRVSPTAAVIIPAPTATAACAAAVNVAAGTSETTAQPSRTAAPTGADARQARSTTSKPRRVNPHSAATPIIARLRASSPSAVGSGATAFASRKMPYIETANASRTAGPLALNHPPSASRMAVAIAIDEPSTVKAWSTEAIPA